MSLSAVATAPAPPFVNFHLALSEPFNPESPLAWVPDDMKLSGRLVHWVAHHAKQERPTAVKLSTFEDFPMEGNMPGHELVSSLKATSEQPMMEHAAILAQMVHLHRLGSAVVFVGNGQPTLIPIDDEHAVCMVRAGHGLRETQYWDGDIIKLAGRHCAWPHSTRVLYIARTL